MRRAGATEDAAPSERRPDGGLPAASVLPFTAPPLPPGARSQSTKAQSQRLLCWSIDSGSLTW